MDVQAIDAAMPAAQLNVQISVGGKDQREIVSGRWKHRTHELPVPASAARRCSDVDA
jgi:tyrosyl-tRNA synthetase